MGYAPLTPEEEGQTVPTIPASARIQEKKGRCLLKTSRAVSKVALLGFVATVFSFVFLVVRSPDAIALSPFEMLRIRACPGFFQGAEISAPYPSADYITVHQLDKSGEVKIKTRTYELGYNASLFADGLSPKTHYREYHLDAVSPFKVTFQSSAPVYFFLQHEVAVHQDHRHGKPSQPPPQNNQRTKRDEEETEDKEESKADKDEEKEAEWKPDFHGPHQYKHGKHHGRKHGKQHWKHDPNPSVPPHNQPVKSPQQPAPVPHNPHKTDKPVAVTQGEFQVAPTGGRYVFIVALPKDSEVDAHVSVKIEANINTLKFEDCPFASALREGQSFVRLEKHDKHLHIIAASPHAPAGTLVYVKLIPRFHRFAFLAMTFFVSWVILHLVVRYLKAHTRKANAAPRPACFWARVFARRH